MAEGKDSLRLWLRLLTCSTMIEREVRARLRSQFGATLPRFDMMAALEREPDGLNMGELSRRLMVSNGNVTGVADRLAREGLVKRWSPPDDRRSSRLALTARGRKEFTAMAKAHQGSTVGNWPPSIWKRVTTALPSRCFSPISSESPSACPSSPAA